MMNFSCLDLESSIHREKAARSRPFGKRWYVHPGRLTWNLTILPCEEENHVPTPSFSGSMLNLRGCMGIVMGIGFYGSMGQCIFVFLCGSNL